MSRATGGGWAIGGGVGTPRPTRDAAGNHHFRAPPRTDHDHRQRRRADFPFRQGVHRSLLRAESRSGFRRRPGPPTWPSGEISRADRRSTSNGVLANIPPLATPAGVDDRGCGLSGCRKLRKLVYDRSSLAGWAHQVVAGQLAFPTGHSTRRGQAAGQASTQPVWRAAKRAAREEPDLRDPRMGCGSAIGQYL